MSFKPCIYALIDPLYPNQIRYIGKTIKKGRLRAHEKEAKLCIERHSHKLNWIRSLLRQNRTYIIQILQEFPLDISKEDLFNAEIYHIAKVKLEGHNLTNSTSGGEGGFVGPFSEIILNKIREKAKESWKNPKRLEIKRQIENKHRSCRAAITRRNSLSTESLGSFL